MELFLTKAELKRYVDRKVREIISEQLENQYMSHPDFPMSHPDQEEPEDEEPYPEPGGAEHAAGASLEGPEAASTPIQMRKTAYGNIPDLSQLESFGKAFAYAKRTLKTKYFFYDRPGDGKKYQVFNTGMK